MASLSPTEGHTIEQQSVQQRLAAGVALLEAATQRLAEAKRDGATTAEIAGAKAAMDAQMGAVDALVREIRQQTAARPAPRARTPAGTVGSKGISSGIKSSTASGAKGTTTPVRTGAPAARAPATHTPTARRGGLGTPTAGARSARPVTVSSAAEPDSLASDAAAEREQPRAPAPSIYSRGAKGAAADEARTPGRTTDAGDRRRSTSLPSTFVTRRLREGTPTDARGAAGSPTNGGALRAPSSVTPSRRLHTTATSASAEGSGSFVRTPTVAAMHLHEPTLAAQSPPRARGGGVAITRALASAGAMRFGSSTATRGLAASPQFDPLNRPHPSSDTVASYMHTSWAPSAAQPAAASVHALGEEEGSEATIGTASHAMGASFHTPHRAAGHSPAPLRVFTVNLDDVMAAEGIGAADVAGSRMYAEASIALRGASVDMCSAAASPNSTKGQAVKGISESESLLDDAAAYSAALEGLYGRLALATRRAGHSAAVAPHLRAMCDDVERLIFGEIGRAEAIVGGLTGLEVTPAPLPPRLALQASATMTDPPPEQRSVGVATVRPQCVEFVAQTEVSMLSGVCSAAQTERPTVLVRQTQTDDGPAMRSGGTQTDNSGGDAAAFAVSNAAEAAALCVESAAYADQLRSVERRLAALVPPSTAGSDEGGELRAAIQRMVSRELQRAAVICGGTATKA